MLGIVVISVAPAKARAGTVAEQYLLAAINNERLQHELAPLHIDEALHRAALAHAREMATRAVISHRFDGEAELAERAFHAGAHFSRITENVAEGASVAVLHEAWMQSPGHRTNILDPAVDAVGIAAVESHGRVYAVEDFTRIVAPLSIEHQERAVGFLMDGAGVELLPSADARRTCAMATGYAGDEQPSYVVRSTTSDLTHLPERLRTRLLGREDRRAAVGACSPPTAGPFTEYRFAVVLYR